MTTVEEFLARYPANVNELANAVRAFVRTTLPDAEETLDESGRVVGYAVGAGYAGLVCTIIPSKTGVKLGIVRGAELPDPRRLLDGSGKRHRYIEFATPDDVGRPGIEALLRAARASAR
jgi:hypothetical protein